jgi:hypothetical protein
MAKQLQEGVRIVESETYSVRPSGEKASPLGRCSHGTSRVTEYPPLALRTARYTPLHPWCSFAARSSRYLGMYHREFLCVVAGLMMGTHVVGCDGRVHA